MNNNDQRPPAALINKEWFESAASVLEGRKLALLVLYAVQYVLYGITPETEDQMIKVVFAMIRPSLDSDISKYRERCARNAANARSGSQRVEASGSQSQRVGANTTPTTTTTTTTTPTTTPSISQEEERSRERFIVYGYFWSIGSSSPMEEMEQFWSYYESLGWKNNKGAEIVSKLAAARMWRRQFETRTAPDGASVWFKVVQTCKIIDPTAFTIFAGAERIESKVVVRLRCTGNYLAQLREAVPDIEPQLRAIWRCVDVEFEFIGR